MPASLSLRSLLGLLDRAYLLLDTTVRLPTAMFPLGTLLLVAHRTGSYGTGGLAVAALSLGGGVGGPLVGYAADRWGQRLVCLVATVLQLGCLGVVIGAQALPLPGVLVLVALTGIANPQAGAMSRSRWAALARTRGDRRDVVAAAMAFEGAIDEASFVVGPVLVGVIAAATSAQTALGVALVLALLTQVGFGLHPSALPGRPARATARRTGAVPLARLGSLLLAMGAVGIVFGITQAGVAARMSEQGSDGLTGPVYAAMGVGSALTGLLTTRLPHAFRLETRIAGAGLGIALAGLVAAYAGTAPTLALGCLLLGIALAPALISSYALAEHAAPEGWATTTMTALATANVVGVAAGAASAGQLIDAASPTAALLGDCVAGALVLLGGLLAWVADHRGR